MYGAIAYYLENRKLVDDFFADVDHDFSCWRAASSRANSSGFFSPNGRMFEARVTVRFLADEDLRDSIIQGLRSREPALDILDVKSAGLRGTKDPALLEIAAAGKSSPGLFVVPDQPSAIGDAIEWLLLVWTATQSEEWRHRVVYVPIR